VEGEAKTNSAITRQFGYGFDESRIEPTLGPWRPVRHRSKSDSILLRRRRKQGGEVRMHRD
jgi:hypothetical protein